MRAQKTIVKRINLSQEDIKEFDDLFGRTHNFKQYIDKINISLRAGKLAKKIDFNSEYIVSYEPVLNQHNIMYLCVSLYYIGIPGLRKQLGLVNSNKAVKSIIRDSYTGQFVFKHGKTTFILLLKDKEEKDNVFHI